ncbi:MAG: hypothetical protein OXB90_10070 [Acidimicrobiaceae bacterium]|nr:hypothetical protein [Acidimicrobiaceae bacterium]
MIESSESEDDAFDQVGCVGYPDMLPVADLCTPAALGAAQLGQLRWTVAVDEVVVGCV